MQEEWIKLARPARPFADLVRPMPLPENTNSINFPALVTGTAVAAQADGGAVQSTDASTGSVNVPVRTIAGQQDMSQQLVDRSIPGFDVVIFDDLTRAYTTNLDVQTLSGTGTGPNALGVLNTPGISTVTFTSGTPTLAALYAKVADAIQRIHTLRLMPPSVIVMHPRRWAWALAQLDAQNRPLVVPTANAFNPVGILERVASEAVVGTMQGLPVVVDASIPTTGGAGTNEDKIIVTRAEDLYLFEEPEGPRTRILQEVLSGTLQVRAQLFGYFSFTAQRYPAAVSVISGSGLSVPTF